MSTRGGLAGRSFQVWVPWDGQNFYRLLHEYPPTQRDFLSNRELGKRRRQRAEDAAMYRGISVRENLDQALTLGQDLNQRVLLAAGQPPFTHVAEVRIVAEDGHAAARTLSTEGHHTIWGEPDELASRVADVWTIEGERV